MYDVSGLEGDALSRIKADWSHLTEELRLTQSPAYVFDRGRPVVGLWGLGFKDRPISPEQAAAIIHYFKTAAPVPATVLGGVPASWRNLGSDGRWTDARTEPAWARVYRSLDIISPWSVGRFRDETGANQFARWRLAPDVAETQRLGIGYLPVIFPGFSWHNGAGRIKNAPIDEIPRHCGALYRHQVANVRNSGARMVYTAMFDEINEGTAIFKLAADESHVPTGVSLVPLDDDHCTGARSDMYLREAGAALGALRTGR
jgi:hypothetical protein